MKRLIETDEHGNWSLKGLPWEELSMCLPIAPESYKAICDAICRLKDYEDTGLSPARVEELRRQQDQTEINSSGPNSKE